MFQKLENVPVRVAKVEHERMERDEKEFTLCKLTLEINPFTVAQAQDIHDYVRGTLFTRTDAEVTSLLGGATFRLPIGPQEIVLRMAPDQGKATLSIDEARVGALQAKRSKKKSTAWRVVFTLTFHPTSKDQLAAAVDSYLKTRYITFADAQGDLFAERAKERRTARSAGGTGANATAH